MAVPRLPVPGWAVRRLAAKPEQIRAKAIRWRMEWDADNAKLPERASLFQLSPSAIRP